MPINMIVDIDGRPRSATPEETNKFGMDFFDKGNLIACVIELNGEIGVHVLHENPLVTLEALKGAVNALEKIIKGHA